MANKPISMIQLKRIVQLKTGGYSKLKISKTLGIHRQSLENYLRKFESTGRSYQELQALSEAELGLLVYSQCNVNQADGRYEVLSGKFKDYKAELQRVGVTLRTLWEEYRILNPQGYAYSQFCEHYRRYNETTKATMRFEHIPGENMQIDFAGSTITIIDRETGELLSRPVLVCVLPCSGEGYLEALVSAKQEPLFVGLSNALEYYGGVPRNVICDNMAQIVKKNSRYEFTFQELADQWSVHNNTNFVATRPKKPKDKPTVENNVWLFYMRVFAKMRNEEHYSLESWNRRARELLEESNRKEFQKLQGSRHERFIKLEKDALGSLPEEGFVIRHKTKATVQSGYHVVLGEDWHMYSVPFQYIGKKVTITYDHQTVEIFVQLHRIAIHKRDYTQNGYTTLPEHMPEKHSGYRESKGWDIYYFEQLGTRLGPHSELVFKRVLASRSIVEQTYRACIGLKSLSEKYGRDRFEAACKRALIGQKISYGVINNILKNNLDKLIIMEPELFSIPLHDNLRGREAYE